MARAKSKSEPDPRIKRPNARQGKLAVIRDCFATQPKGGWDASEQNHYLESIGLEKVKTGKARTDEEIDFILADLEAAKMILFE